MRGAPLVSVMLRTPQADDLPLLGEWNAALIRDESHDNPMTSIELIKRMREWLASEYRARIFVCDGIDVGYALYRVLPEFTHLRQFYVVSERRRRGIGTAALHALGRLEFPVGKRVIVEAMVGNEGALSFWRASGFADRYVGLESSPASRVGQ